MTFGPPCIPFNNIKLQNIIRFRRSSLSEHLSQAVIDGDLSAVKNLLAWGAPINGLPGELPPLNLASYHGHTEVVNFLLQNGASVDQPGRSTIASFEYEENFPIGKYRRGELLGRGAMGAVHRYIYNKLHLGKRLYPAEVAVKSIGGPKQGIKREGREIEVAR